MSAMRPTLSIGDVGRAPRGTGPAARGGEHGFEVLERLARAECDAAQRIVDVPRLEAGPRLDQLPEPAQQRAAAGEMDAAGGDVARQLRRGVLERGADRVDDVLE